MDNLTSNKQDQPGFFTVNRINESDNPPYNLLLLADPSRELIDEYLKQGECYVAKDEKGGTVGVYVLIRKPDNVVELKNIAVDETHQGKGYGKKLVLDAVERARKSGARSIEVGTGNSSLSQLALYQKCGFRIVGVDRDFFIRNYSEEIIENGIKCIDMVKLSQDL